MEAEEQLRDKMEEQLRETRREDETSEWSELQGEFVAPRPGHFVLLQPALRESKLHVAERLSLH